MTKQFASLQPPILGDPRSDLIGYLNAGVLMVNYLGHGSVAVWAQEGLFGNGNAYAMTNGAKAPFVVALTCFTGFFHDLYTESLAEAFLRAPNGGAIAVWGSSALTYLRGQEPADRELFRQLLSAGAPTIGEAVIRAKNATFDQNVRKSWILFGDPTTRLRKSP